MKKRLLLLVLMAVLTIVAPLSAQDTLNLELLGRYTHGGFDEGASEIAAYDPASQTLFVTNAEFNTIDLLDMSDPANLTLISQIDISELGDGINSVAFHGGVLAAAIEADPAQEPGLVAFFTPEGELLSTVPTGALPDMVTFTPDGSKVITANEGEPNDDYTVDPLGGVTIIDISSGIQNATAISITFEGVDVPEDVRVFGPGTTPAQDLEPEYVAVSPDSSTAYVTLQEANAVAIIDITNASVSAVVALGFKDHSLPGNELDAGNDDGVINITNWPVFGMYQPDAIAAYVVDGLVYLVTANEGDTRDYDGYSEEGEIGESEIDPDFPGLAELLTEEAILGLGIVESTGDTDGDGDLDVLYVPGARSFSIWSAADGSLVYDSGADFEMITAERLPDDFNSTNDENGDFDGRSDNKGPEPEGVTLGMINGSIYAFIVLERIGGVMIYDVSDPMAPVFAGYSTSRDFSGDAEAGTAGDLGPEASIFISAEVSPIGEPLLVVTHEISATTVVYAIR